METAILTLKIPNELKVKVLEELVQRQKKSFKRFTQTDFVIELLEGYFENQETPKKSKVKA